MVPQVGAVLDPRNNMSALLTLFMQLRSTTLRGTTGMLSFKSTSSNNREYSATVVGSLQVL